VAMFVLRRAGSAVVVFLLASVLVFIGIRALPGDPARVLAGQEAGPGVIAAIRHQYGLDQPLPVQYIDYLGRLLHGDLGRSTQDGLPVSQILLQRLPITIELSLLAIAVAIGVGVTTGVVAAARRGRTADYFATAFGLVGLSVPHFWLSLLAILLFAVKLHWLPASGFVALSDDPVENLRRMVMPAVVLGTGFAAVLMRQTRAAMLGSLSADYTRTARAKGIAEWRVIGVHALRNSLTTVVTILGLQLGELISGAVITESIFVIPGFGKLTVDSVLQRNYPVIQSVVLVTVMGYIVVNLCVDILYAVFNPRIRVAGGAG
jgi:peptide/nickel transport system permease protein